MVRAAKSRLPGLAPMNHHLKAEAQGYDIKEAGWLFRLPSTSFAAIPARFACGWLVRDGNGGTPRYHDDQLMALVAFGLSTGFDNTS